MKINYKMLVGMLQEQLIYVQDDLKTTMADLEVEEKLNKALEEEIGKLSYSKNVLEKRVLRLNDDFFRLGDMFMANIGNVGPLRKIDVVVTGAVTFMETQYQSRIKYLEELIFEMGDDMDELAGGIIDTDSIFVDLNEEIEDMRADWAQEASEWGLIDKAQLNELVDHRRTIRELKDEIAMKAKATQEAIYADKKCKYDLEQKIASLQKENTELLKKLGDRQAIDKKADGAEACEAVEKEKVSDVPTENKKQESNTEVKDFRQRAMLAVKNRLHDKNYDVTIEGKALIAKKQGTRQIEVKYGELPGSLKYIICGQTCYEFDQAIKASTYGIKAITPKNEEEAIS